MRAKNFFVRDFCLLKVEQRDLLEDWELVLCNAVAFLPRLERSFGRVKAFVVEHSDQLKLIRRLWWIFSKAKTCNPSLCLACVRSSSRDIYIHRLSGQQIAKWKGGNAICAFPKFTKNCQLCQNSRKLQKMPKFAKFAKMNQKCFNLPKSEKSTKFAKNCQICQEQPNVVKAAKFACKILQNCVKICPKFAKFPNFPTQSGAAPRATNGDQRRPTATYGDVRRRTATNGDQARDQRRDPERGLQSWFRPAKPRNPKPTLKT